MTTWQDVALAIVIIMQGIATIWTKQTHDKVRKCGDAACRQQLRQMIGVESTKVVSADTRRPAPDPAAAPAVILDESGFSSGMGIDQKKA